MQIVSTNYIISSSEVEKCPAADRPEYAFIGRSNVGKSSLINSICQRQHLAKTSADPGKTQLINHFAIESLSADKKIRDKWYIVDLPGYGYAKVALSTRKKWDLMITDYLRKRRNLVNLFVLIDSRHHPQKIDLEYINRLGENQIPITIVFTKSDKEKPTVVERNIKNFLDEMRTKWMFLPQSFVTSAHKNSGREDILQFVEKCNLLWKEQLQSE
jgi:GTP-binding protein